jgi:hypothetical protein
MFDVSKRFSIAGKSTLIIGCYCKLAFTSDDMLSETNEDLEEESLLDLDGDFASAIVHKLNLYFIPSAEFYPF